MTSARRNEIESKADNVLSQYHILQNSYAEIPNICTSENISLLSVKLSNGIDGIFCSNNNEKIIYYNEVKPFGRQNFTKAHELGHYFLEHELKESNFICDVNKEEGSEIEAEANYYAACFLMPKRLMFQYFCEVVELQMRTPNRPLYVDSQPCNIADWKMSCNYFCSRLGVSSEALRYRLEHLGLLDYRL